MAGEHRYTVYKALFWVTQLLGLTGMLLLVVWVFGYRGGLAWNSQPKLQFNWHVLLMPLSMTYLGANELMVFRALRYGTKKTLKLIHSGFSVVILLLIVIGYWAILDCHNYQGKPNWFSLHSWLGVLATLLYLLQAILGCASFLWPGAAVEVRKAYMPFHVFVGLTTFVLGSVVSLLGMFEEMKSIAGYKQFSVEGIMMNFCGILFGLFTILVVYMQTCPNFKRLPLNTD